MSDFNNSNNTNSADPRVITIATTRSMLYRGDKIVNNDLKGLDADLTTVTTTLANLIPSGTVGNIMTSTGTGITPSSIALTSLATLANPTFTGAVVVPTPVASGQAATKSYVDSAVQAIASGIRPQLEVRVATTGSITLSGTQTVDGIALNVGDRVLVLNQGGTGSTNTNNATNGVYIVATGAWTFAPDYSAPSEGWAYYVSEGTVNGNAQFAVAANNQATITPGTTLVQFVQVNGLGAINVGTGLLKSGNTISANIGSSTGQLAAGNNTISLTSSSPALTITGSPVTIGSGGTLNLGLNTNVTLGGNTFNGANQLVQLNSSGNFTLTTNNLPQGATNLYYTTAQAQTDAAILSAPSFFTTTTTIGSTQNKNFFTVLGSATATITTPTVNRDIFFYNVPTSTGVLTIVDSTNTTIDMGDGSATLGAGDSRWLAFNAVTKTYTSHA